MTQNDTLKSAITILGEIVAFDTTSRESNLELIAHIQSYLHNLGIDSRITHDSTGTKANLWATIGPDIPGGVVLSGHLDVVPVDGQDWSQHPFTMWQQDGKLLGRGVVDMKGFVAMALAMVPQMLKSDLKIPIHLAFSYDEEIGCIGVRGLIADVVKNLPMPRAVIVGEPTSMKIIGGHKGSRSLRSTVQGVPAHSSDPRLGANSIMAAARLVTYLENLQQELISRAESNCPFDPPYTTIDLGLINGGTAGNITPEFTTVDWGMRIIPTDDGEAIEHQVRNFIDEHITPGLKKVSPDAGVTTELTNTVTPLVPDSSSAAEQLIRHLTGLNDSSVVSFGTEAGLFQSAGIPAVVFGPGSINQAHQPDEFIEISQLQECITFLYKLTAWAEQDNPQETLL
ncbi:acetylornithine deacetylase (ArgE) [Chromatiales bacterium (ex Bugula neritina AB1)]|nr:acetylornithine deacetylase (ArgE) [Chromatiales bacterium (ex Bugula neritina AB1)]